MQFNSWEIFFPIILLDNCFLGISSIDGAYSRLIGITRFISHHSKFAYNIFQLKIGLNYINPNNEKRQTFYTFLSYKMFSMLLTHSDTANFLHLFCQCLFIYKIEKNVSLIYANFMKTTNRKRENAIKHTFHLKKIIKRKMEQRFI